jgi:hypothetical protein
MKRVIFIAYCGSSIDLPQERGGLWKMNLAENRSLLTRLLA